MAAFLALISAGLFGAGDFMGGAAARKTGVFSVIATSHLVGFVLVLGLVPFMADQFLWTDLGLGAVSGLFGLAGIFLIYHSLSRGPMTVVAPITSVAAAIIPVFWGLGFGEHLSPLHLLGICLGLVSILLISRHTPEKQNLAPLPPWLITESLLAGVSFAGFFIVIDNTSAATEPWPLVGARLVTVTFLVVAAFGPKRSFWPEQGVTGLVVGAGVADVVANVAFLMAANRGLLSLVAVLSSLYPAATVLLARWILKESLQRIQVLGLFGAVAASTLIALG